MRVEFLTDQMRLLILTAFITVTFFACRKDQDTLPVSTDDFPLVDSLWTVGISDIKDGNVGKNGIKAIDEPEFVGAASADFITDEELVLGIYYKGKARAYPVKILNYHEVVNDQMEDFAFTISYSVLTGTGVIFPAQLDTLDATFSVSGLLYKSNLLLYDRSSESVWSQMLREAVSGPASGAKASFYPLFQTSWKTWKAWFPDTQIMSPSALVMPDYDVYPYGNYDVNNDSLLFGVTSRLQLIPNKERILGIQTNGNGSYMRSRIFGQLNSYVTQDVGGQEVLVFGSEKDNYMMAYYTETEEGAEITIKSSLVGQEKGGLFTDTEGNKWDINGKAYEGPKKGAQLKIPVNYVGYAFAWAAFYPDFFLNEQ